MYEFWITDGWLALYVTISVLVLLLALALVHSDSPDKDEKRVGALAALMSPVWPLFLAFMVTALLWKIVRGIAGQVKMLYDIVMGRDGN